MKYELLHSVVFFILDSTSFIVFSWFTLENDRHDFNVYISLVSFLLAWGRGDKNEIHRLWGSPCVRVGNG
jgi:hypothetical protein